METVGLLLNYVPVDLPVICININSVLIKNKLLSFCVALKEIFCCCIGIRKVSKVAEYFFYIIRRIYGNDLSCGVCFINCNVIIVTGLSTDHIKNFVSVNILVISVDTVLTGISACDLEIILHIKSLKTASVACIFDDIALGNAEYHIELLHLGSVYMEAVVMLLDYIPVNISVICDTEFVKNLLYVVGLSLGFF